MLWACYEFGMKHWYNEINPHAAELLRRLIANEVLAAGDVDERSITEVTADDLKGYTQCHFFAGLGGWPYAARLAGWDDERPLWTGSCPCQPFSAAGKGLGFADERHLWPEWQRLIEECRPASIVGEQVAAAAEWVRLVRGDLEAMDYAVGYLTIEAACVGAIHKRDRGWIAAHSERYEQPWQESCVGKAGRVGRVIEPVPWDEPWESALLRFRAMGDGLQRNLDATDAARNAIVPQVAAEWIMAFMETTDAK